MKVKLVPKKGRNVMCTRCKQWTDSRLVHPRTRICDYCRDEKKSKRLAPPSPAPDGCQG